VEHRIADVAVVELRIVVVVVVVVELRIVVVAAVVVEHRIVVVVAAVMVEEGRGVHQSPTNFVLRVREWVREEEREEDFVWLNAYDSPRWIPGWPFGDLPVPGVLDLRVGSLTGIGTYPLGVWNAPGWVLSILVHILLGDRRRIVH